MADVARVRTLIGTRAKTAGIDAGRRIRNVAWPVLQQSAAATAAWVLALYLATDHVPFFAPVAAIVALNTRLGGRGLQAVRLLLGVTVGILVGAQATQLLGIRLIALPLAVLVAMLFAAAVGGAAVTMAQSGASAVLTVTIPYGGVGGFQRLFDALLGVAVALVFSQLLFPPQPLRLMRRAEIAALQKMALGLRHTAAALNGDVDSGEQALRTLREVRQRLDDVGFVSSAGLAIARRSLTWRHQRRPVVAEQEVAAQLEYVGPGCLTVARTALAVAPQQRAPLTKAVESIADALELLALDPASAAVRSRAADLLTTTATELDSDAADHSDVHHTDDGRRIAIASIDLLVEDILEFCGIGPGPTPAARG
ncbi:hypothetical protein AU198_13515 [Mycobacterium sp. GA-1199]|uniref:FUSC family protein n=1 Tax=Mycobacterium sp. GA-1199 TaxID=1772287 RepID=UPI000748A827|nr:FUSC family protein [Mycobacterium sp. GA-1199]KUI44580.1 hypothetical protein AU198_13515 [Mycobacterium sp. GA-1199]